MGADNKLIIERLKRHGLSLQDVNGEPVDKPCSECPETSVELREEDGALFVVCASKDKVRLEGWLDWLDQQHASVAEVTERQVMGGHSRAAAQSNVVPFEKSQARNPVDPDNFAGSSTEPSRQETLPALALRPIENPVSLEPVVMDGSMHRLSRSEAPRSHLGEKIIMAFLALVFLGVGLLAAAMSGFANFQAFASMVDDPLQSQVWGWTGIIACICSFGGFTFAYWHGAGRRYWEAGRAMVIALAGAATSLVGTQLYMQGEVEGRANAAEAANARAIVLEAQIEDWRSELGGIDPEIRSVEGLEAYIAEVERVGRTHERPYRAALDELGQARRRDDLQARIETARSEFADFSVQASAAPAGGLGSETRSWFIAGMLEVFSSQGTSIGFVALMILAGRRRPKVAGAG